MRPGDVWLRLRSGLRHRLVGDTLWLSAGQVAAIAAQAVASLIVARVLGPIEFGAYALVVAMVTAAGLLDLTGSDRVALMELARAHEAGDRKAQLDALAAWLVLTVTVNGVIVTLVGVTAPAIGHALYGRADIGAWARWFCLPALLDVPFDFLALQLQARRQMRSLVTFESARIAGTAVLGAAAVLAGFGLGGLAAARVIGSAAASLAAIRAHALAARADEDIPSWSAVVGFVRGARIRSRAAFGVSLAVGKSLGNLAAQLPVLILGVVDRAATGPFTAALRIVSLPYPFVTALSRGLDVALPAAQAHGADSVRQLFVRSTAIATGIWSLVSLAVVVVAPFLVGTVLGPAYEPALPAVYGLFVQSLGVGAAVGINAMLRSSGRAGQIIAAQALSIAVAIVPGYLLIRHGGATGAAWFHSLRQAVFTIAGLVLAYRAARAEPR